MRCIDTKGLLADTHTLIFQLSSMRQMIPLPFIEEARARLASCHKWSSKCNFSVKTREHRKIIDELRVVKLKIKFLLFFSLNRKHETCGMSQRRVNERGSNYYSINNCSVISYSYCVIFL